MSAEQQNRGLAMAQMYLDGVNLAQIAARYGVSLSHVSVLVTDTTGQTPRELRAEAGWVAGLSPAAAQEVFEAYRDDPDSLMTGSHPISRYRLEQVVLAQTGMTLRQYNREQARKTAQWQAREKRQLKAMRMARLYVDGASTSEIGALYGVTKGYVSHLISAETGKSPVQLRAEAGWVKGVSPKVAQHVLDAHRADPHAPVQVLAERTGTTATTVHTVFDSQVPPIVRAHGRAT